ncbi:Odorant binding protein [Operophtera brumata]|uniref:Odorant binding protein n=1 Tax=Operophtera brumata TaxID=104452 RepID=A0A0L7LTI8_OPEBR|nr:Odorant binding protein [Operophtera brumata]
MSVLVCRVLFLSTVIIGSFGALDISKYLKVCDRNSVDVNDCMVEAVQSGIAAMADGILDLGGATVLDARVKADDDRLHVEIDLKAPMIFVKGLYEGEGQYNALKINANGGFNTTMSKINSVYMRPDVDSMSMHLSNENPDSKELTELGNTFVNHNWQVLYRELLPYAQANWNRSGVRVANKIFLKIPYIQIFPISS